MRLLATLLSCAFAITACSRASTLPDAMSDREFWHLVESFSEPAGTFDLSENLVSNEPHFVENIRRLGNMGGVYVGVGPEQNFSYVARLRPAMAFVVDIRRENRNLHLLYKALFELSADRADFVSRLFSRPRPDDLAATASAEEIFERFAGVPPSSEVYDWNARLVREWLVSTKRFALSADDLVWMGQALRAFYAGGPDLHFWVSRPVDDSAIRPSYRRLMTAKDATGQRRSFLASEDSFGFVKELHSRNLIVPLVGDFAGPHTLRRVAEYVRRHGGTVQAFYGSNVGVYLTREQTRAFCANLATFPTGTWAWFIERDAVRFFRAKLAACGTPPAK